MRQYQQQTAADFKSAFNVNVMNNIDFLIVYLNLSPLCINVDVHNHMNFSRISTTTTPAIVSATVPPSNTIVATATTSNITSATTTTTTTTTVAVVNIAATILMHFDNGLLEGGK